MSFKINENNKLKLRLLKSFSEETKAILSEISSLASSVLSPSQKSALFSAKKQFTSLTNSYQDLGRAVKGQINACKGKKQELIRKSRSFRTRSQEKITRKKSTLASREVKVKSEEKFLSKSLTQVKSLWQGSIETMEKTVKVQRLKKVETSQTIQKLNEELAQCFMESRKTPFLERVKKEISVAKINVLSREPSITFSVHSYHSSNDSIEFEKLMAEQDRLREANNETQVNVSIEKSMGGWKSEFESETESNSIVNPDEIKSAISVLKKYNLLDPGAEKLFGKISAAALDPESSQNIEFLLQLLNLQGKDTQFSNDLACTTPKGHFMLPEDFEMGRTMLSSENPITSRKDGDFDMKKYKSFDEFDERSGLNDERGLDVSSSTHGYLRDFENMSPGNKASPIKKAVNGTNEYQSTGISSQTGLRSRTTLKTAGSEFSQKIYTPGSKGIGESFKYL